MFTSTPPWRFLPRLGPLVFSGPFFSEPCSLAVFNHSLGQHVYRRRNCTVNKLSKHPMRVIMSEKERYDDPRATELRVTKNSSSSPGNNRRKFIHISTLLGTATVFGEVAEPSKAEARNIVNKKNVRKIALEEHFNSPSCAQYLKSVDDLFDPEILANISDLLVEFDEKRIGKMDAAGISIAVLSQTSPGIQQETDSQKATLAAKLTNDFLASNMKRHPERFRGFACIALQDPKSAVAELERCINELGFVGVLVNGHTRGHYLDEPAYDIFWKTLVKLGVPLYLHPTSTFDQPDMFKGAPGLDGAFWSWTCETGSHALRLAVSGIFERYPSARVILGHMGETLPFQFWRFNSRSAVRPRNQQLPKKPSEIIKQNFLITTSGVCSDAALLCSLAELGEDSVMFATDYPYEDVLIAGDWINSAPITDEVRRKVCWDNASRLLKIE